MQPARYCDVALPVPLDRTFSYSLPASLRDQVSPGARVVAPFGPRKLSGVVVRVYGERPDIDVRDLLRVLDEEPALTEELLHLGEWIAEYYCSPIGEVLKSMLPLGSEIRSSKTVELSPAGRAAAERFRRSAGVDDPAIKVLQALEARPLNEAYLKRKVQGCATAIESLKRQGYLKVRTEVEERDPLRSREGRFVVSAADPAKLPKKAPKSERWLVEYLLKDPGPHDLESLAIERKDVAAVARRLARQGIVKMEVARDAPAIARKSSQVTLNLKQREALREISGALEAGLYRTFLLRGVTGSGKTEVYMASIEATLVLGKTALLLVPEIGLTPAVASQFFARFGDQVAILHSAFSGWQRAEQWRRIRRGEARVVIGTRSGVFAPVPDLGLVIVDEEHESSYKQDEMPRYHGRNVGVMRAMRAGATVVLGSATPSLESRYNAELEKYGLLEMPERIEERPLPQVEIIDMRREFVETRQNDLFSRSLAEQIEGRLAVRQQTMILLNRRGFSMYVLCRACGHRIECQNCSVTLTFHRHEQQLLCHYCDYAEAVPEKCPQCSSEHIYFQGSGSEKVEDELRERFPRARIARLDRDSVKGRDHYEAILGGFREGSYDILVGTQMIAKGHDIPNVTLVGVVSADVGLGIPDFRAAERTFQLLTQVAGRAGRGEQPGKVVMQTMNPDHWAIKLAAEHDYGGFYKKELYFRRLLAYPPYASMATLLVRSKKLEEALAWSGKLAAELRDLPSGVTMLGPAAAPVHKLKTEYRYQFLLKAGNRAKLRKAIQRARAYALNQDWPATGLVVDVDPMSLL